MIRRIFPYAVGVYFLLACALLPGQATSSLTGSVTDPSGGAIPGARVKATEQTSSAEKSVLVDAAGQYSLPSLPAGTYTVTAEFPGFSPFSKRDVAVSGSSSLAIVLQPSSNSTSVDVEAKVDPFQVVPDAPTSSVFGLGASLADTPR